MTELKPEMMQNLFMKNSDSVAVISGNRHLLANEAYVKLFSYSHPDEIIDKPFLELFLPEEKGALVSFLDSKKEDHEIGDLKTVGVRKDNSTIMVEMSASLCNPDSPEPDIYLIAIRDNTSNYMIRTELEKSRRSLNMIRQCHQILLREDREKPFLDKICQMISETDDYDLAWFSLIDENGSLTSSSFVEGSKEIGSVRSLYIATKCMTEKKTFLCNDIYTCPLQDVELENVIACGFKSIISMPLLIGDSSIGAISIYSKKLNTFESEKDNLEDLIDDVTYGINSIRMNEKQIDLEKQLLQAQKMETIGTLAGGIAHDFNNIMTPIMGYSEMILSKMTPDNPLYKYNEQILNGAVRARELVKQIMAFSHKENHKKEPVYIDRIVKETLQLMSSLIPKTITIHKHLGKHTGKIDADPAQIHQVIANLCTNSFHAMEETGGSLTVELKRITVDHVMKNRFPELNVGEYAQLVIGDTGKGMDRSTQNRIFEPFFTTKPVGKGTGLGLSVVHGIIKNHKGLITVESEIGLGTVFRIFFPLIVQDEDQLSEEYIEEEDDNIILLLDDHRDITELLKLMLLNCGYSVEVYNSSEKALNSFKKKAENYALIITDLFMPQINGLQFVKEVNRIRKDIPSLLITGHEEELSENMKREYNIKKIIRKPILRNNLIEAVSKIVKRSRHDNS